MAVKRSGGLGRGLDALFSDSSIAEEVAAEIDEPEAGTDDPVGNGQHLLAGKVPEAAGRHHQ